MAYSLVKTIFFLFNLLVSDTGPYGVVRFTCTSSQLNENGNKKALPLLLIFQLLIKLVLKPQSVHVMMIVSAYLAS